MKELIALTRLNLKGNVEALLGDEKRNRKIVGIIILVLFINIMISLGVKIVYSPLYQFNSQLVIVKSIFNVEILIIFIIILMNIMKVLYLGNDWRSKLIYPIKSGSLLLSNIIVCITMSLIVPIFTTIPMIVYGVLDNTSFAYYISLFISKLFIVSIPAIYITLISLSLFYIVLIIRRSKVCYKKGIGLLAIDILVVILSFILLRPQINKGEAIINIFFSEGLNSNLLILISIIVISFLGFSTFLGDVYLSILKSEIFKPRDKNEELESNEFDFKLRNHIVSNILRDIRIIFRNPNLRNSCITMPVVTSLIIIVPVVLFRDSIMGMFISSREIKFIMIIYCILTLYLVNPTPLVSFSREGSFLKQLRAFPMDKNTMILSKISVALLSNTMNFITVNILIILFSSSVIEFVLLEITTIIYIVAMSIIFIGMDISSMDLKWNNIKDVLTMSSFKGLVPVYIITILDCAYLFIITFILEIEKVSIFTTTFFIIIPVLIYCSFSIKKIKKLYVLGGNIN